MTGQKNIIPTSSKLLAAASILILFVLCGLVFVFYKQGVQEKLKLNWVEHTEDILFRTTKILETVTDNETGSRGFVITGQSPFLEPLQQSKQFIQGQINVLAALINEDPGQRSRIDSLIYYMNERMRFSDSTVQLRKKSGLLAAAQLVSTGNGRASMDHVRQIIKEIEGVETGLLAQRKSEAENAMSYLLVIGRTVIIVVIALLIMLFGKARLHDAAEHRATQQLKNNEELFRSMVSNIKDYAIFMLDPTGIVTTWNDGAKKIKGYKDTEIIGKSFELFYDREDISKGIPAHNLEMAERLDHYEHEGWRLRKDGSRFYADVVFTALRDEHGQLYGYTKITRDITDKKKAEEAGNTFTKEIMASREKIAQSEERFRGVVEQAINPILILKGEQLVLSLANDPLFKVWGVGKSALGQPMLDILPEMKGQPFMTLLFDVLHNGVTHYGNEQPVTFARESGETETLYFNFVYQPYRENDKSISGVLVQATDVTAQVAARRKIEANERDLIQANNELAAQINEKERLTKELLENLERISFLATITESIQDPVISTRLDPDQNAIIASWNKPAEVLLEWTSEETVGTPIGKIITSQYGPISKKQILELLKQNASWQGEGKFLTKSGRSVDVLITASSLKSADGRITGFLILAKDITERKKSQRELELLVEQLNQANDAIYTLDPNLKVTSWNRSAEKIYGYTKEEMLGKNSNEILQTNLGRSEVEAVLNEIDTRDFWTGEIKRKTKSGVDIYVRSSNSTVRNSRGVVTGYVAVSSDITAEITLRKEVDHLARIVEQTSEAIFSRGVDRRIISWNNGAEKMFGITRQEALGKTPSDLSILQLTNEEIAAVEVELSEKGMWKAEMAYRRKDGTTFYGAVTSNMIKKENGDIDSFYFIIKDITRRKNLEEQLMHSNERLEKKVLERTREIYRNEKRFRALVENNFDLIALLDGSFHQMYQSPSVTRAVGFTATESQAMKQIETVHPEDQVSVEQTLQQALLRPGELLKTRYRRRHKDGHYIWLEGVVINLLPDEQVGAIVTNFRDVTERVVAEERIKETLKELSSYKFALDASDIVAITDQKGTISYANDNFCRISKYSRDELIGQDHRIVNSGFHPREFIRNLWTTIARGNIWKGEMKNKAKDGTIYWVDTTIVPFIGDDQKPYQYIAIRSDITERKKAEETIVKTLKEKNNILESIGDAFFAVDTRWTVTYWNRVAEISLQVSKADIIGKNLWEIFSESVTSLSFQKYHEAIQTNQVTRFEDYYDSLQQWFEISAYPSENGLSVYFKGISERKKLQDLLLEHEEQLELFIEHSPVSLAMFDKNMRYIAASRRWVTDFNLDTQQLTGLSHYDIFPEIPEHWKDIHQRCLQGAIEKNDEELFRREDGSENWIRWEVRPWHKASGEVGGIIIFSEDVSDRKKVQEKIKNLNLELEEKVAMRTEQLKKSNEEMEAFSYSVSHDLRAPLRGIIGFTNILEEDYGSKLDDEARRITSIIKKNTSRMGQLVDDLLTFSRMGRQELIKTNINSDKLVAEIIEEVRSHTNESIIWQVHPLSAMTADLNTIRQVWVNLISNAVKYSGKKENPVIEIGSVDNGASLTFFVRDNGVGFDEKYKAKLFKVFQRLHGTEEFEGTGIGLAIVDKIIAKHGGKVWAEASKGHGAVFYFSLPTEQ